jgi:hypothetical protein
MTNKLYFQEKSFFGDDAQMRLGFGIPEVGFAWWVGLGGPRKGGSMNDLEFFLSLIDTLGRENILALGAVLLVVMWLLNKWRS